MEHMKTVLLPLEELKPYDKNPRIISDKAIEEVKKSLEQYGFNQPIVVDREMRIVAGHTRFRAAQRLKLKRVPVWVKDFTEDEFKGYNVADNKTAEKASWDLDTLREIFSDEEVRETLKTLPTGFSEDEIDRIAGLVAKDEYNIPDFDQDLPENEVEGVRQIILIYPETSYDEILDKMNEVMERRGIPTVSDLVMTLAEERFGNE